MSVYFYKYVVSPQVFYKSKHTYALVNLKPLVPGHVLVVPLRTSVLRLGDLTTEESHDYMDVLQLVQRAVRHAYGADSLNVAIQDGPESGQSVPHLHTHVIPRHAHDGHGDGIHRALEQLDMARMYDDFFRRKDAFQAGAGFVPVADDARVPRTSEDMEREAAMLAEVMARM